MTAQAPPALCSEWHVADERAEPAIGVHHRRVDDPGLDKARIAVASWRRRTFRAWASTTSTSPKCWPASIAPFTTMLQFAVPFLFGTTNIVIALHIPAQRFFTLYYPVQFEETPTVI